MMNQPFELPVGLTLALSEDAEALRRFSALPEDARVAFVDTARKIKSGEQMRAHVRTLAD